MIKAIIIAGVCFTIGNIVWDKFNWHAMLGIFEYHEQKIFYVPLAVLLWLLVWKVWVDFKGKTVTEYFLIYLWWLAAGNVVKQVFYTKTIKHINDYVWGGLLTLILIIALIRWAILNNRRKSSGTKPESSLQR